jgi:hypothetical protein
LAAAVVIGLLAKAFWPTSNNSPAQAPSDIAVKPSSGDNQAAERPKPQPSAAVTASATPASSALAVAANPATTASRPALAASKPASKVQAPTTDKARSADASAKLAKPSTSQDVKPDASLQKQEQNQQAESAKTPNPAIASSRPAAPQPVVTPSTACANKLFLAFHSCMLEQCARPGFERDPACIERLEIERKSKEQRQF